MSNVVKRPIIEARNVKKKFITESTKLEILKGVDLSVGIGEFISIMGPSGCGKSTFLYLLGGLDEASEGEIYLYGKDISKLNDEEKGKMRRRDIGFIFQFYNLVPNLTVAENIILPVVMDGKNKNKYTGKLNEILEFVDLTDRKDHFPSELSGGQQQRVAIARALIMSPKLIFADEPIGNLDSKAGIQIMKLFKEITEKGETTIVQVTHSEEAASYGSQIIRMKDGVLTTAVKNYKKQSRV